MRQQEKKNNVQTFNKGQRRTVQRQMILRILEEAEGHLTMEQLTVRVQSQYPSVSLSTFYRNVDLLIDQGLLRANHLPGESTTYELTDEKPHVHLICQRCHSVTHLDERLLELFPANLEEMTQFHATLLELKVTGYCSLCWNRLHTEE